MEQELIYFLKRGTLSQPPPQMQSPFYLGLSYGHKGGIVYEKKFKDMERKINPSSQEWKISLSQPSDGLTNFRKENTEGTTEVLGMRALTNLS